MSSPISSPSSVTVPLPSTVPGTSGTAASGGAGTSANVTPLYSLLPGGVIASGPLGLRTPRNAEDLAAILAEVSLALDDAFADNRAQAGSNAVGKAREAAGQLASIAAAIEGKLAEVAAAKGELAAKQADKARDETRSGELGGQIADKTATINALDGQLATERAKTGDQRDQAKIDRLQGQRDAAASQRASLVGEKGTVDARIAQATIEIAALQATVAAKQGEAAGLVVLGAQINKAVMSVFAQVDKVKQTGDTASAPREEDRAANLEHGFEDIFATIMDFRAGQARVDAEIDGAASRLDAEGRDRVFQAVVGLATGLGEALSALEQARPDGHLDAREAALQVGERFRLSI